MNHIDNLYLQIIYNTCTQDSSKLITVAPDDINALIQRARTQSSLPFLLPYIKEESILTTLKHETKLMMLNYYQIERKR